MNRRFFLSITGFLMCMSLALTFWSGPRSIHFTSEVHAQSIGSNRVYLPLVRSNYPAQNSFAVEMTSVTVDRGLPDVVNAGATWVRRNGLLWSDVEPVQGAGYNWNAASVKALEQEMLNASANDVRLILIVRGNPGWATVNGSQCAPLSNSGMSRFASFLSAAVARYSVPPYNVLYWELGNEPDGPQSSSDSPWGCWGNPNDTQYFGGQAYGNMLKVVYPAVKAANPAVRVLNGGLLLGNLQATSANFISGIFAAGAGTSFDILAFHSYSYYFGPSSTPDGTGGAIDQKIIYLRNVLAANGAAQKPLFNTEGALLCGTTSFDCKQPQADALGRMYARTSKDGLLGFSWYMYDSDVFKQTALVDPNNVASKRPAYYAYKQSATMIGGASYLGPLTGQPGGVEGYRFQKAGSTVTVFWANNPQWATIPVGGAASVSCSDRDGNPVACSALGGNVVLTAQSGPTYVVAR